MNEAPTFPPLFHSEGVTGATDPFAHACLQAREGCDAGLVVHNVGLDRLQAAVVFAPEVPLAEAMSVAIACGIGFQNALGALAPPETAVHLTWSGGIRINGATCGGLRLAASHQDPLSEPDWLVVGLNLALTAPPEARLGETPDQTYLYEEGCAEVGAVTLLEAWIRHSLAWINRMESDGNGPLNNEWSGLAQDLGKETRFVLHGTDHSGTFTGVDEQFGMLLRSGAETRLIPLTDCLEHPL